MHPLPDKSHNREIAPATSPVSSSEYEQAWIRLVMGVGLTAYYLLSTWQSPARSNHFLQTADIVMASWFALSIAVFIAVKFGKPVSRARRLLAITGDVCNTTYFFDTIPDISAPLYCLYLWYAVGNGFRYGVSYLYYTLCLASVGFSSVVAFAPYWEDKTELGIGLALGMIAISLYFGTLAKRLQSALDAAKAANQAKRQFVSSISHEMRTPLNAIIGMTELLRSTKLTSDQAEMTRSLESGSKMLLALVNDVLDFSKIEAGKIAIERVQFDLRNVIGDTMRIFTYQAAERGLELEVEIQRGTPTHLLGDPFHLRQILTNFLSNAIKFTPRGRILLKVEPLAVKDDEAHLLFAVEDTGIGIPTAAKAHIFESFTQADPSMTSRYGGTGLGTTIAKQLVELMGGRIGFRSEEGVGSTFWCELRFPRHSGATWADGETISVSKKPRATISPVVENYTKPLPDSREPSLRVLVVDDNGTNRTVITRMLEILGHLAVPANSGDAALDLLDEEAFDLVIVDMNMPEMSGMEVFTAYNAMRRTSTAIPFVMLTADASAALREESLKAGFTSCLSKPITFDALRTALANFTSAGREEPKFAADRYIIDTQAQATTRKQNTDSISILDPATLRQFETIFHSQDSADKMVMEFMFEAQALMDRIDSSLSLQRTNQAKQITHELKGCALSIGAAELSSLCERFIDIAPSEIGLNGRTLAFEMRQCLAATHQALKEYRRRQPTVSEVSSSLTF